MTVKKFTGIKPFSFQKDVIDEVKSAKGTGKTVVVKSRRQVGKSMLICNLLLYFAINYAKTTNYSVSPTLKQGKKLYKSIVESISGSGIIKARNATDLSIQLINGSYIYFKSAEQKEALRGETCSGLLCIDEAAYISDDVFNIILPWCDFHKAVTLIVSTPFIKSGFFFRYYNYGLNNENNTISIDWNNQKYQEDLNKILPLEKLAEYERTLPRNVFLSEYMGEFLDTEGMVFTNYNKCIKHNIIKPNDKLFVGIDYATGNEGDDTVVSMFNDKGEQVYLDFFNKLSTTRQIERIYNGLEPYLKQIIVIACELNSIGTPMTDLLKKRSQVMTRKIVGFNTTNTSKNALVTNFQVALEKEQITLLPIEKQIQQLSYYTAEYNPKTRNVSYNAPVGLHDDICMADMFAYDAYRTNNVKGKYVLR